MSNAGMGGKARFQVNTAALRREAENLTRGFRAIRGTLDQLEKIAGRTEYYWTGEAGNDCRDALRREMAEAAEMLSRFSQTSKQLLEMAGNYEEVERAIEGSVTGLPRNVIR